MVEYPKRTPLDYRYRASIVYRDGEACRLCLSRRDLHVHHVDGYWNGAAALDDSEANLVTLCAACHRRLHSERVRLTTELIERAERIRSGLESVPSVQGMTELRAFEQPEAALLIEQTACDCAECAVPDALFLHRNKRRNGMQEYAVVV